ncbi:MAG: bifunctional DNA-formamidopyrimidine glycosylase/DNA-(apurinic or apyrimidinic site) lyase [Gemmatimonadaceae bacterium]|nr:bifunctional DNA-formamidopyrimidine glycosylase/DNA-(apurinic or apyrimidinic site) lyase [Gemmatimonadaceae bacterium]
MPELPETETIARDLHAAIVGTDISETLVLRADVLRGVAPADLPAWLTGRRIIRVWRRAKSVVISTDGGRHLVVTPRFTGALIIGNAAARTAYTCLIVSLGDGRALRYDDVRRLGTVAALNDAALLAWSARLGPEPLDPEFTAERFSVCIRGSNRAIKAVLMDQGRLAGVGNIYANEALWRAGIRPSRRATSLRGAERLALHRELRAVLQEAVEARGTSFRDYRDAFGAQGGFAAQLKAYGRGGEPCARCGAPLKSSHVINGRATVWCASCQR